MINLKFQQKIKKRKVPQGVEDSSIAKDPNEAVFHSDIMQEGPLGVWDEGVRDPEQRHQTSVYAHTLIPGKHQPGIPPALTKEDSCCVVLRGLS